MLSGTGQAPSHQPTRPPTYPSTYPAIQSPSQPDTPLTHPLSRSANDTEPPKVHPMAKRHRGLTHNEGTAHVIDDSERTWLPDQRGATAFSPAHVHKHMLIPWK